MSAIRATGMNPEAPFLPCGSRGTGTRGAARWRDEPVYPDYNATTPVDARVAEAARPYWDQWFGSPPSGHGYGEQPRQAVARAHVQVPG